MDCAASGRFGAHLRGFSLVELAVAIAVVSVLLYLLLDRVLYMQEMAEKTEVEETVRSINYALRLEAASRMARGSGPSLAPIEKENPVKWLETRPRNYLGEYGQPPEGARPAYWYYHSGERSLVYRPNRGEHLTVGQGKGKHKELRFVVKVDGGKPHPMLQAETDFEWFGEIGVKNR